MRHVDAFMRILAAYPMGGPALLAGLCTYANSMEERARDEIRKEVGAGVCQGLHNGPSSGVVCRSCIEAEGTAPFIAQVEEEMAKIAEAKQGATR